MHKIWIVDAFTSRAFSGNPAGVCVLAEAAEEIWMQSVAAEMKHAETAFVYRDSGRYNLRWFTPKMEVPLCGHATLATSHVIWEAGISRPDVKLEFATKSGALFATRSGDGWIELDFPEIEEAPLEETGDVAGALGCRPKGVYRYSIKLLVELDSEATVRRLQPNFRAVAALNTKGVIVTAPAEAAKYDFVSRFFAPALGIDEDPGTGSAHCALAPYWQRKLGKNTMLAYQASVRGGEMRVTLKGGRVILSGQAITGLKGELAG